MLGWTTLIQIRCILHYRSENPATMEIITKGVGKNLTNELNIKQHGNDLSYIINHLKVGRLFIEDFCEKVI